MKKQIKIIGLVISVFIILAQCGLNSFLLISYYRNNKLVEDLNGQIQMQNDIIDYYEEKEGENFCALEKELCEGLTGIPCCEGLTCWTESEENYPDQSGICIKE
jgi:hypothetical protein